MKIATWNVNSIRTRLTQVMDWLQNHPIDVLCLQETKVVDKDFPRSSFEEAGWHLQIAGQKSYNGVAIATRAPLQDVMVGFVPVLGDRAAELDGQKRLISGTIDGIRIVNIYLPNGSEVGSEKFAYKLAWMAALHDYLAALRDRGDEICACGDFNVTPDDRDVFDSVASRDRVGTTDIEREALAKIRSAGFADALRKFTEEGGRFTWWDYRSASFRRNRGWRIDLHYLSPAPYDRACNYTIDIEPRSLEKPSDHVPAIVELR